MRSIDVCLSPELISLYDIKGRIIVVIDILRATSCMTTAFAHGVKSILPVASLEECRKLKNEGFTCAAERDGKKEDGFDLGNSPFSYMNGAVTGKSIALTTTNGTNAIRAAKDAKMVVIGSFLNLSFLCEWLRQQEEDVICLCAGWKNVFNLEDTLFAGAVVEKLIREFSFSSNCDSAIASRHLYNLAKKDLYRFLENSSHRKRLEKLQIEEDISYCLTPDQTPVLPVLQGNYIVKAEVMQQA